MHKDYNTIWNNCLNVIRSNVSQRSFKTWFEPITAVGLKGNSLIIQVPNKFFYEWLEEHYISLLKKTLIKELGSDAKLEYQIIIPNAAKSHNKTHRPSPSFKIDNAVSAKKIKSPDIKNPFIIPGIQKVTIDPQLNPNYTFKKFIEGDCNRVARAAGVAVSKNPGGTAFNPLFIFGNVGLGKTHLAQSIGNEVLFNFDSKTVLYVSSEKFTNQIIQAIKNNAVNDFVNFYQLIDVLIVDDIQFLANKTKTQEIFFHIFNQLHQGGKQLVLTSDRPPKDLNGIEDRLISRFKWGLSVDLDSPDLETRMAIFEAKIEEEGIHFPKEVIEYVCYNIQDNIRELEGVMISLLAYSSLNDKPIDIPLTKEIIKNFINEYKKEVSVDNIKTIICEHYNLSVEQLEGKSRKREIVIARQVSMYFAKKLTDKPYKFIGSKFGGRDHSTVIHSFKAVANLRDTDSGFKNTLESIEKKIQMTLN